MTYRIICFTKSLALAITPFLFALVGVICESAIVPGVYNSFIHRVIVELEEIQTKNSAVL